ncbi:MAG TPA: L-aspartate oxidase [Rhodospirillaceae bacterium]|nr:L-aspartate oxidase [Rhodospirillaceae bacterium]
MTTPVIIGAGLAGLTVALSLAPNPCIVLGRKMAAGWTSSELAQGGIAAAVGADDAPVFHEKDTLAAGAGLCDQAVVHAITEDGPRAIAQLRAWGVVFDLDANGALKTGLEGAHSRRRVVHAEGDSTGAAVMRALVARVRATPSITVIEDVEVMDVAATDGCVTGVVYRNRATDEIQTIETNRVVLATGSACALWQNTTVPLGSWGHGLLLASRAGARLRDLEFVQFHPTALDVGCDPMPLISEAVRGEGARLVNDCGKNFIEELAPRDVVARAIHAQIASGRRVFLDARAIADFAAHFPTVFDLCAKGGIDPTRDMIPVRPVAHYHMGGIETDSAGATTVRGLWACGECAATGLHGANRLASNSLLEAVVMGQRVAGSINTTVILPKGGIHGARNPNDFFTPLDPALRWDDEGIKKDTPETIAKVRAIMTRFVGVRRDAAGLQRAIDELAALEAVSPRAQVGLMIARAALARTASVGAHYRMDETREHDDRNVA